MPSSPFQASLLLLVLMVAPCNSFCNRNVAFSCSPKKSWNVAVQISPSSVDKNSPPENSSKDGMPNVDTAGDTRTSSTIEPDISSPVLEQVYPELLSYIREYGHPDIPLGTSGGRMCNTLRRLRVRDQLAASDVELLDELGFTWHSLEDVYRTADFDKLYKRLVSYGQDYSPPKKYAPDPELGAWVTGIRRVGCDDVPAEHRQALDDLGFLWVSPRKCGSSFMTQYRSLCEELPPLDDDGTISVEREAYLAQARIQDWIQSQRLAVERGTLSETRKHYLEELLGENWL